MRRALSISLIVFFWLPALVALAPGSDDVRLPYCCRRQGAHHCAMDSARTTSETAVKAPSRCSQFPSAIPATVAPAFVAPAVPAPWPALQSAILSRVLRRDAARSARLRAQVDRGPPSFELA